MAIQRDWHIDAAIAEITVAITQDPKNLVLAQLFPDIEVDRQSDKYYVFDRGDWARIPEDRRARFTQPNKVEYSVSSDAYYAQEYALEEMIDNADLANADKAFDLTADAAAHLTTLLMLAREKRLATKVTCGTNMGSYAALSATDRFSDFANSDPVGTVNSGRNFIWSQTGMKPNVMVVGQEVDFVLVRHPDIIDRLKYTARASENEIRNALADVFGVDKYIVSGAVENKAGERQANSYVSLFGKNVLLAYVPPRPGKRVPAFGYSFVWKPQGFPAPFTPDWKDDDDISARRVRMRHFRDDKIVGSILGYVINSAV